ncbi:MAG: DUF2851 family protein [Bacteroidetes bacterium]|jgi:hypothetical protein|nr:DUF2851 family protein [Bacteroidota bacterium]
MFTEQLLHFIWQYKLLDPSRLATTDGQAIHIRKPGTSNPDAGPDFLHAQVRIGGQLWAGHVEMHLKTSDWKRHGHHSDPAYKNVVLHVVYEHDEEFKVPTLELKGKIPLALALNYEGLMASQHWVACEEHLKAQAYGPSFGAIKTRLAMERVARKALAIKNTVENNQGDWAEAIYRNFLRYFGHKVNADAFEKLGETLPYKLLLKHADNSMQVEAILMGCAGFLHLDQDSYSESLKKEFQFLKTKYGLKGMDMAAWKLATLRPPAFPTIRLSQLAQVIGLRLLGLDMALYGTAHDICQQITAIQANPYWDSHYLFGRPSTKRLAKKVGQSTAELMVINHFAPVRYAYGWHMGQESLKESSLELLDALHPESNAVISKWKGLGLSAETALDSQALLELKTRYCDDKKCLLCSIGTSILKKPS